MSDQWFYTSEGRQMEPVSTGELKRLASRGLLKPTDLVWREGWPKWERAANHQELFAAAAGEDDSAPYRVQAEEPSAAKPRTARTARNLEELRDLGRTRRRPEEEEGEDEFEERPRRRRRRKQSNAGLIWGLVGGGVGLVVLLIIVILLFTSGESGPTRTWSLAKNGKRHYRLPFTGGKQVDIKVTSNGESDVDLFVFPPGTRANFAPGMNNPPIGALTFDDGDSKNCQVTFVAPATGSYEVVVWNRVRIEAEQQWRNKSNSGILEFKESDPGPLAANPPPDMPEIPRPQNPNAAKLKPGPGKRAPTVTPLALRPGTTTRAAVLSPIDGQDSDPMRPGCFCKIYTCTLVMGKTYTIDMESNQLDSYLRIEDANGQQLAFDDDGGELLNSRIVFQPPQTATYRIIASTLGPGDTGPFFLKVRQQ